MYFSLNPFPCCIGLMVEIEPWRVAAFLGRESDVVPNWNLPIVSKFYPVYIPLPSPDPDESQQIVADNYDQIAGNIRRAMICQGSRN